MTQRDELDLPTVLRECAEHLAAGRDPKHYYEVRVSGFWHHPDTTLDIASAADRGAIRRKPTHKTPTEDDVGRLVMVRSRVTDKWIGPYVLEATTVDANNRFQACHRQYWSDAKLYTGPTRPNWVEHDGQGVPEEVKEACKALCQMRDGSILLCPEHSLNWKHNRGTNDIMRYTIIEP